MFNGSCYLFASYPEVSWHTARSICNGIKVRVVSRKDGIPGLRARFAFVLIVKAELASVHDAEEEQFVESFIRESTDSRSAIYWLGGTWNDKSWYWIDNSTATFSGADYFNTSITFEFNVPFNSYTHA